MTSKILRANGTELTGIKSCVYTEKVNGDVDIRPGCVASASIKVEVYGTQADAPTAGEELTYYQVQDGTETLIGKFYAEPSVPSKNTYAFTAYDAVSKLDVDFSAWLSANQTNFPMTVYALVSAACTTAGVTLTSASWALSTTQVQAFYADGLTCRNILQYAAEIACCFVRCNTAGGLVFDWYSAASGYQIYPGGETTGTDTYIPYTQGGLTYGNYNTATLDRVCVHPVGEDDVAYIYPDVSSGNTLNITNNVLLTGASASTMNAVAQNIYNAMSALGSYRPARINLFPFINPFRAGDIVTVTDIQGVTFNTVVMSMTTSANGATLESTGNEEYNDYASNVQKAIVQLASDIVRINKLKVDWADIRQAIIQNLVLAGLMSVYTDSTLSLEGGHLGYGDGSSDLGVGIAMESSGLADSGDPDIPLLVGRSAVLASNDCVFLGYHDVDDPWFDGGVDVNSANYTNYIKISSDGVEINSRVPLDEIGVLSSLSTSVKTSLVAAINELNARLVGKNLMSATVWQTSGTLTLSKAITGYKKLFVLLGSPSSAGYGTSGAYVLSWQGNNFSANQRYTFPCYNGYVSLFITDANTVTIEHADMPVRMLVGYTKQ